MVKYEGQITRAKVRRTKYESHIRQAKIRTKDEGQIRRSDRKVK